MDPIYALATPFRANELKFASKKLLVQPSSYDRTAIEKMWRHSSRNRMRTNRRMPLVLNNLNSSAVVESELCSENGVVAPKKSRIDVSESFAENDDADKPGSVLETGNSDLMGRKCSNDDDNHSSNINSNTGESESSNFSVGEIQCHESSVQVVSDDTSEAVDGSSKVEDCWWNNVDSRTWLQGLHNYFLLHSAVDVKPRQRPVAVLPPNVTPSTVIANPASQRQAAASATVESSVAVREHQYARPVLTPITGYKVSADGVLSAVPVYYFPVVNYSVCGLVSDTSAVGCQQTYIGGRQSSLAAVDLVSFMHNYCLPATSIPQSSINSSLVRTTCNAGCQSLICSPVVSSYKGPGTLLMMGGTAASVTTLPQQTENSHSSIWPTISESSVSAAIGFLSSSSICLTPKSLSSSSSVENLTDDASELASTFSTVVVDSTETSIDVNATSGLFSADTDLTIPGWFGKGLGIKRSKRRLSRQS